MINNAMPYTPGKIYSFADYCWICKLGWFGQKKIAWKTLKSMTEYKKKKSL
jgi:hypothetical protein